MSRLVGAPPGYVGHEDGGQLTEAVRRNPYTIVLLDEIEKAHPDDFNILLQVLDDGRLTDSKGRVVDFKNTVVIMTSNAGSQYLLDGVDEQGNITEEAREQVETTLKATFKPEFLNRIDDIVMFSPLTLNNMTKIVFKMIQQLSGRLEEQEIDLRITEEAANWLAEQGYDPVYGARPLQRFITKQLETPLARAIISGKVMPQSIVTVELEDDQLEFETELIDDAE